MVELLRTNDPVLLSYLPVLLGDAGVETIVLDTYTSIMEGSIGAIPRRVMVADEDAARARQVLDDAGIDYGDT
jgi:hypothetical protein